MHRLIAMGAQSYPYTVTEEPRDLSDEDLSFLSEYTGQKDLDKLRAHVVGVWRSVKDKAWVYKCIQEFMFLKPRIILHQYYPEVQALIKSGQPFHFLVCLHATVLFPKNCITFWSLPVFCTGCDGRPARLACACKPRCSGRDCQSEHATA